MSNALLILQFAATWYMVGLIWMVQIVHYPLFDRVDETQFAAFEAAHSRLITPIVGLPMLVELSTAIWMVIVGGPATIPRWIPLVGLVAVILIWLVTALVSVPCHQRLAAGFDGPTHQWLVLSNWLRTLLWSGRGIMLAWVVYSLIGVSPLHQSPASG
jgi:uncharacterized membrane protein